MEEIYAVLERHEKQLKALERDVSDLHDVQTEIRAMNETLVNHATTELKQTNENLKKYEQKLKEIENQPGKGKQQIATLIIAALTGGFISTVIGLIFTVRQKKRG